MHALEIGGELRDLRIDVAELGLELHFESVGHLIGWYARLEGLGIDAPLVRDTDARLTVLPGAFIRFARHDYFRSPSSTISASTTSSSAVAAASSAAAAEPPASCAIVYMAAPRAWLA